MDIIFSKHAHEQMIKRNIDYETVLSVVFSPDNMIADEEDPAIVIFQSLIKENERIFLLRVFVNNFKQPNVIVTLYKTTKISKYHEGKI